MRQKTSKNQPEIVKISSWNDVVFFALVLNSLKKKQFLVVIGRARPSKIYVLLKENKKFQGFQGRSNRTLNRTLDASSSDLGGCKRIGGTLGWTGLVLSKFSQNPARLVYGSCACGPTEPLRHASINPHCKAKSEVGPEAKFQTAKPGPSGLYFLAPLDLANCIAAECV